MKELITNGFTETLPPGKPTLSITTNKLPEVFNEAIGEMSEYNPLDYLRLLKFFEPTERTILLQLANWDKFAESISLIQKDSEASLIAEAAREALGAENTRNLASNLTRRTVSKMHQLAGIRLTGGLPLTDISGIFAQYANIARAEIEYPIEGDEAWINFFFVGMHSLYICTMANRDMDTISEEEATRILTVILDKDISTIARRITKPKDAIRNTYMMEKIRDCMTEPSPMDRIMNYFEYKWEAYQEPKKSFDGISQGEYKR